MKKLKKFFLTQLIKYIRWDYLRKSINVKAKYLNTEEKMIGIIDNASLKRNKKKNIIYKLETNFIRLNPALIKACQLDKEIEYRIENINFENAIEINGLSSNASFHFKNCTFDKQISISYADTIILENNNYYDNNNVYFRGDSFLNISGYVDKLQLKEENFVNSADIKQYHISKPRFGIHAKKIKTLEIINSTITASELGEINLEQVEHLNIKNSSINAPEIYMKADKIEQINSSITAEKGIIIDNQDNNTIHNLTSPIIIYNGIDFSSENKSQNIYIDEEKIELQKARQQVIKTLRKYSNEYKFYLKTKILPQITVSKMSKTLKKKKSNNSNKEGF